MYAYTILWNVPAKSRYIVEKPEANFRILLLNDLILNILALEQRGWVTEGPISKVSQIKYLSKIKFWDFHFLCSIGRIYCCSLNDLMKMQYWVQK